MPARIHRAAAPWAAGTLALTLAAGCFAHMGEERRELTPQGLAVQVLPGRQEISIRLAQTCRPIGGITRLQSEYDLRVHAVQLGANVAQVINEVSYSSSTNGNERLSPSAMSSGRRSMPSRRTSARCGATARSPRPRLSKRRAAHSVNANVAWTPSTTRSHANCATSCSAFPTSPTPTRPTERAPTTTSW